MRKKEFKNLLLVYQYGCRTKLKLIPSEIHIRQALDVPYLSTPCFCDNFCLDEPVWAFLDSIFYILDAAATG